MSKKPSDHPVRITAEERLHPALRTLGRACIALARWQREQANTSTDREAPPSAPTGPKKAPAPCGPTNDEREAGDG